MIQRIQTVYLILALACISLFYFLPFGKITVQSETEISEIPLTIFGADFQNKEGIVEYFSSLPLLLLISISALILLLTIFFYKKRMFQIRLCILNLIISLGSSGLAFFFLYKAFEKYGIDYTPGILIVLPIVASILIYLALRAIGKDEALVRSIDRIR